MIPDEQAPGSRRRSGARAGVPAGDPAGGGARLGARPGAGPISRLLDAFGSVWFGVVLLFLLFLYSSIGSAGLPIGPGVREYPFILRPDAWVAVREMFELSEFEWFHWWPFDVLIGLLCACLVTTTIRRIPPTVLNLGVWMIHSGIIVLALGSVWYFSTKLEGDAPIARRRIVARVDGAVASMIAAPGNQVRLGSGAEAWILHVTGITPDWELLSGDDKGKRAYKVSVLVQSPPPAPQTFVRELLAGYPQYTEDLVSSDDPGRPFARAKKTLGTALVDERLSLALEFDPQEYLYLHESAALYLREVGRDRWVERPIRDLPRYKEHVASYDEVWMGAGAELPRLRSLAVVVPPADDGDPLPGTILSISDYLPYASIETRVLPGGDRLDPAVSIRLRDEGGRIQEFDLQAFHPQHSALGGGVIAFHWVSTAEALDELSEVRPPALGIRLRDEGIDIVEPITGVAGEDEDFPFTPIGDSSYAYRVSSAQDGLVIQDRAVSVAIVDIRRGEETFTRWVFDDPALTRDLSEGESLPAHAERALLDENLQMTYRPGRRSGLRIVAGPGETDLRLFVPAEGGTFDERIIVPHEEVEIQEGITLTVTRFAARSRRESRPFIVPPRRRDRDVGVQASMIRVHVPAGGAVRSVWLPFHVYPFARSEDVLPRFPFQPTVVHLDDGRHVELLFSRERRRLPAPVALDEFRLTTHIGGYAGSNASVRNWTSVVRFLVDGTWSEATEVSVNEPKEHDGFWFFQSQWDPPMAASAGRPASAGLNYTVLGVGNREGVLVQLAGCCIAVTGMIYAFYVKPTIKRRRRRRLYGEVAAAAAGGEKAAALAESRRNGEAARAARASASRAAVEDRS